jgi:hypothetical protein
MAASFFTLSAHVQLSQRPKAMITDYKPFLRVTNGHIWWVLKDARRLGAGYRPIRNDKMMTTNLQAFDDQARVNELTLLGAFNNTQLTIE